MIRAAEPPVSLAIIGQPVAQSLSPAMQGAALTESGRDVPYERLEVAPEELRATLDEFARVGMAGNVTMPHKEAVYVATVQPSALARRVGSVNTFWHEHGMLCGHNSDVAGVLASLRVLCPDGLRGRRAALLGAGGSAAATLVALEMHGCTDIRVAARTPDRAQALAERVHVPVETTESPQSATQGAAIVINATPLGMRDDSMPIDVDALDADTAVFDLVYRQGSTAWVRAARARGLRAEDGLRMLVEQGAESFRVWFNAEPSLEAMWNAVDPRSEWREGAS